MAGLTMMGAPWDLSKAASTKNNSGDDGESSSLWKYINQPDLWNSFGNLFTGVGSLGSAWLGNKNYNLAKQMYNLQKDVGLANLYNQANTTQRALADRKAFELSWSGVDPNSDAGRRAIDNYMAQYPVTGGSLYNSSRGLSDASRITPADLAAYGNNVLGYTAPVSPSQPVSGPTLSGTTPVVSAPSQRAPIDYRTLSMYQA